MKAIQQRLQKMMMVALILALSISPILAQESVETAAAESSAGPGWMVAILGMGVLVILGLGGAMAAQQSDETQSSS